MKIEKREEVPYPEEQQCLSQAGSHPRAPSADRTAVPDRWSPGALSKLVIRNALQTPSTLWRGWHAEELKRKKRVRREMELNDWHYLANWEKLQVSQIDNNLLPTFLTLWDWESEIAFWGCPQWGSATHMMGSVGLWAQPSGTFSSK